MKQGVTYEILSGQDGSFEWMYFYISRNGKRIDGPVITGSDLDLKLRYLHPGDTPEIVLWSEDYGATYLVMKPNLTDPKKPGFEILEDQNLGVWYPPLGYNNQE